MDIFSFRDKLVDHYGDYISSFINIRDPEIRTYVEEKLASGIPAR